MTAQQLWCPNRPLCFAVDVSIYFSPLNFRGRSVDRHQTFSHVRWWFRFIKFGQISGGPSTKTFGGPKNIIMSVISQLDGEYISGGMQQDRPIVKRKMALQTVITPHMHSKTNCILNSANFGLKSVKNRTGVSTHTTGGITLHVFYTVSQKTVPTYFLLLVCQIWTDFNNNRKDCPGRNP